MTIETNETGNRLLAAMNKWLIAHEDAQIEGAFCGLKGENVEVWLKMDAGGFRKSGSCYSQGLCMMCGKPNEITGKVWIT